MSGESKARRRTARGGPVTSRREAPAETPRSALGPFHQDVVVGDKVSTADIFAETDIIPFMRPDEEIATKFYDLRSQAEEELRLLRAAYERQTRGEMTQEERELSNIVSDFKRDLKAKVSQENADIHYHLGIAFMEQGLYTEAIEEFSQAAKDKALALDCFSLISYCHRQRRDFPDGEKWLKKALVLARQGTDQYYALEFDLAELYELSSDKPKALSIFKEILSWNPGYRNISLKVSSLEEAA